MQRDNFLPVSINTSRISYGYKKTTHGWLHCIFQREIEGHHYGWLMLLVNYSWVHMSFRLLYPARLCFESSCWFFLFSFFCLGQDLFWDPLEFYSYLFLPFFSSSCHCIFSPCFLVHCFNSLSLCKQTKVGTQMFHWCETSATRPNRDSR